MKLILFFLSISFLSFGKTQAGYIEACILVNGNNPTPSSVSGSPDYAYKCPNGSRNLTVKNCGTSSGIIDPSNFNIYWNNLSSSNPTFNYTDNPRIASEKGKWKVTVIYDDPIFGTHYEAYDTVEIFDYTVPEIIVWGNTTADTSVYRHCSYDMMTFHATTGNQFVPGSYKWFINPTSNQNDTNSTVASTGTTLTTKSSIDFYATVIARDLNGCRVRDKLYAPKQDPPPTPNLGVDKYKCAGSTITLNAYTPTSPVQANYTYSWNGNPGVQGDASRTITAPGLYTVTVDYFPLKPCKISDTIYIYETPAPVFTVGNDTSICYQAKGALHAKSSTALTYTWTPSTYFSGGNSGANPVIDFNGVGLGTYSISVTGKDVNNCTTTKTQNVTHLGQGSNPYMNVTAVPLSICNGTSKQFITSATTTYTTKLFYEWTPATHLDNPTIKEPTTDLAGEPINTPFNYSLKISDSTGCYLTIATSATLFPSVIANVGFTDSSLCAGNNIMLQSSATGGIGSLTYTWSPSTDLSDPSASNPVTTPTDNRFYTVTVSDSKGCQDTKTVDIKAVNVMVNLIPTDTLGYSAEAMVLDPTVNSSSYSYQWTNLTTSTSLGIEKSQVADATGIYAVYAIDPLSGCNASDTINVTILLGNPRLIYIPNVVNPASSDTENKTVKVYGTAVQENDFTFRIYNKWGEMIYETTSFTDANTNGWNGVYRTANGTEQNLSVYTYSVHGKFFDGKEFDRTGSITLMR